MEPKKVQKQGRDERTQEDYPTTGVYFCRCRVVFLRSFISALFLYFFRLHPYLKSSFTETFFPSKEDEMTPGTGYPGTYNSSPIRLGPDHFCACQIFSASILQRDFIVQYLHVGSEHSLVDISPLSAFFRTRMLHTSRSTVVLLSYGAGSKWPPVHKVSRSTVVLLS